MEYIQTNLANGRREQTLLSKLTLHYITRISDEEMDLQTKTKIAKSKRHVTIITELTTKSNFQQLQPEQP